MEVHGSLNLIGYGLSAIGGGIGVGLVFAAYINGVARQPEAQRVLQPIAFLGLALTEALAILGLVFAFVIGAKGTPSITQALVIERRVKYEQRSYPRS